MIKNVLPAKDSILTSTDCFTDIIACISYATIINIPSVSDADLEMLWDYCIEVGFAMSETIILVGDVDIPKQLKKNTGILRFWGTARQPEIRYFICIPQ